MPALLGEPAVRFHEGLARLAAENSNFRFHYVTAREMYNLVLAAEAGWKGPVDAVRNFRLTWKGDASARPAAEAAEPLAAATSCTPA